MTILDASFATVATGSTVPFGPEARATATLFSPTGGTYYAVFRDLEPSSEGAFIEIDRDLSKATQSKFVCKTQKPFGEQVEELSFTTAFLDRTDVAIALDEESGIYVDAKPNAGHLLGSLNENIELDANDKQLRISGDADGFFLIELALYRDSGFTKGYVKLEDLSEGTGDLYSEVDCTIETIPAK